MVVLSATERPYHTGTAGRLIQGSEALTAAGLTGMLLGRKSRLAGAASGAALLGGSALMRFGVFQAGITSADDPEYTIRPQRERIGARTARETPDAFSAGAERG